MGHRVRSRLRLAHRLLPQAVGAQPCPRPAVGGALVNGDEDRLRLHRLSSGRRRHRHLCHLCLLGRPHHQHPLPDGGTLCFPSHAQVRRILVQFVSPSSFNFSLSTGCTGWSSSLSSTRELECSSCLLILSKILI